MASFSCLSFTSSWTHDDLTAVTTRSLYDRTSDASGAGIGTEPVGEGGALWASLLEGRGRVIRGAMRWLILGNVGAGVFSIACL